MIDGPACRDTDSDRARIHSPGIYLPDEACKVAGNESPENRGYPVWVR